MKRGTWIFAVLVLAAGCESLQPRTVRIDSTVGMYQMAKLSYRIDAGKLSEPVNVANITGKQVSYEQKPSGPYADRSVARLAIEYPHPGGKPGFALAEVIVEARKPPAVTPPSKKSTWRRLADDMHQMLTQNGLPGVKMADGIHEAWSLDLPRADLDSVIGQLSQTGYFHLAGNPSPGVNVSCKIDGQQCDKQWGHVTALDELVERVRNEGQLVSYTRPLDDEPLKPGGAQPVRFATTWPPAGAVPTAPGTQRVNSPGGDWVANQAGAPAPQPRPWQGTPANWQGSYMTASANQGAAAAQGPYSAAQDPYQPVAQGPYQPVAQGPYQPVAQGPYQPVAQGPYQPVAQGPYQPVAQGPYQPVAQGQGPNQPVAKGPYQPAAERPYRPAQPAQYTRPQPGRYPQLAQQPYRPTSQPGGPSGAATGQPSTSQAFPSTTARYPLGSAAPTTSPSYGATGTSPSYGPDNRAADGTPAARY